MLVLPWVQTTSVVKGPTQKIVHQHNLMVRAAPVLYTGQGNTLLVTVVIHDGVLAAVDGIRNHRPWVVGTIRIPVDLDAATKVLAFLWVHIHCPPAGTQQYTWKSVRACDHWLAVGSRWKKPDQFFTLLGPLGCTTSMHQCLQFEFADFPTSTVFDSLRGGACGSQGDKESTKIIQATLQPH